MTTSIAFDPYLGWVDVTSANAITESTRLITAADLLRYENLGQAVETFSASVLSDIANLSTIYEPKLAAGTVSKYYRGDKTWATLDRAAVGLGNVDNTTDLLKPVSTATQAALDNKVSTSTKGAANGVASLDANALIPHAQHRWWTGSVLVSINAAPSGTASVTFPAGRFSAPPVVFLSKQGGGMAKYVPYAVNVTATGMDVGLYAGDGTSASGSVSVGILALPLS